MGKYIVKLKSQVLQLRKSPDDKRKIRNFIDSVEGLKRLDDTEFTEVFEEIINTQSEKYLFLNHEYICQNFFPKKYADMHRNQRIPFSDNFQYEIRWWISCFKHYGEKLNCFIKLRKEYDACVLLGRYEKALEIIKKIESTFGVSFWLVESKIFVYTKMGLDTKDIIDDVPKNYISAIFRFYSLKNLNTLTQAEYKKIVLNVLKDSQNDEFRAYIQYRLLPLEYKLKQQDILSIMFYLDECSLIDKYLTFLDIFETIVISDEMQEYKNIIGKYLFELKVIHDEHLEALCFCLDRTENRYTYRLKDKLLVAKEKLIEADYKKCLEIAGNLLEEAPYCIQAINIVTEAMIKLGDKPEGIFPNTLLFDIINDLQEVYSLQDGWTNTVDRLRKLTNCCSMSNWARALSMSVIKSYSNIESEDYNKAKRCECLQYLDIETVCECLTIEDGLQYLSHIDKPNKYLSFRQALLAQNYKKACTINNNIDIECILGICDKNNSQEKKREYLDRIGSNIDTFSILASKCYLKELDSETHFVEALHYVTRLLINNINKSIYVPWKLYIDKIDEADDEIRGDISVPILHYVRYKNSPMETKDDLILMCEDFLYIQGKELPSLLEVHNERYPKEALIFFLRYVCIPDILSPALASKITNSMDLWKERIDICQILCTLDAPNEKIYEKEIRALTQKRKIYSELRIIEENRIHVNVEGIRTRLIEELEGEFARYKLYDDKRWLDLLEIVQQKNGESITIWPNDPERVLKEMVRKIRDAFVSSTDYGLDFALSLSIRHGAIEDALRRPLANARLIAIYNDKAEEYEWNYNYPKALDADEREIIKNAIVQLNMDIEKVINDLKRVYIQVKTESMNENGIFEYCITSYEIEQLSYCASKMNELSEFVEYMFEYLWERTERNMSNMKKLLHGEILQRLQGAYDAAKEAIDNLEYKELANLRRRIVNASNEVQTVIDKICFWFQRSTESKNQDFELDFVFEMGYETICNMHPETRFTKCELKPYQSDGKKIEGKYLKLYSDIFYNLLDNIYKKASAKQGNKKIEYFLVQNRNEQRIYLQNDYDCNENLDEDMRKLDELRKMLATDEYLEHVKGEGGTGIPKIYKIIQKDLREDGKIDFGLKKEENKFYIEISI